MQRDFIWTSDLWPLHFMRVSDSFPDYRVEAFLILIDVLCVGIQVSWSPSFKVKLLGPDSRFKP